MLSRRDAATAIEGGAWYMRKLRNSWKSRSALDAHDLALGSYNAGMGNILKAQGRCGGARLWADIAPCLAAVTGAAHGRETIDYVAKIHRWHAAMELEQDR